MKVFLKLMALCAVVVALNSCATIFGSATYPVSFNTTPEGAIITIVNRFNRTVFEGTSPTVVTLKSQASYMTKEEYKITIAKTGYDTKTFYIYPQLDGWYIGNILLGGLIGMLIVDPISGAMFKIAETDLNYNEKLQPTELALEVYDINHLPDGVNPDDLVRIN